MREKFLLFTTGLFIAGNLFCQNEINVSTTSLIDTVETGTISNMTFTIQNTGDADLDYEISVYTDTTLFTKMPYADYTLPENQDFISPDVIITRGKIRGLFNYARESKYDAVDYSSPIGTLWTSDLTEGNAIADYSEGTNNFSPGDEYSMYIPTENRFFDIFFHSWTSGGLGSGVSYTRVETVPWLSAAPTFNTITGGNEDIITMTFNTTNTGAGVYTTAIVIHSNDADEDEIIIPVTLVDTGGIAGINTDGPYDFGEVIPNSPSEYNLVIYNTGDGILEITDIYTGTDNYTVSQTEMEIYGYLQGSVTVTLESSEEGEFLDDLTIESNAGTITVPLSGMAYYPPYITLSSDALDFSLDMGASGSETLTLSNMNTQGDSVVWSIPENGSLAYMLANINASTDQLMASVPHIFEFDYDGGEEPDYYINDGGADMYDGGNYLNSEYASGIYYSDNTVRNGEGAFGENANYFTRNIRGYFIMVAEMDSINSFYTSGNNGADGSGTIDTMRGNIEVNGVDYLVVTKQINSPNWDPSINHIFILENPDSLTHLFNDDTNDDYDEIQFGDEVKLLHYLLVAARDTFGIEIDSVTIFAIAEQYLEIVTSDDGAVKVLPEWLTISDATSGVISESSSKDLTVSANTQGLAAGDYNYTIVFNNVGQEGFQSVAVNLTVNDTTTIPPIIIDSQNSDESAAVYPNPVNDLITIEAEIGSSVNIFDYTGKIISSSIMKESMVQINVGEFSPGIYVVQIRNAGNVMNKKIVIQ
jgi:hypothetical protein